MNPEYANEGIRVRVHSDAWATHTGVIDTNKFGEGVIKRKATNGNSAAIEFDYAIPDYVNDCHGSTKPGYGKYIAWKNLDPIINSNPVDEPLNNERQARVKSESAIHQFSKGDQVRLVCDYAYRTNAGTDIVCKGKVGVVMDVYDPVHPTVRFVVRSTMRDQEGGLQLMIPREFLTESPMEHPPESVMEMMKDMTVGVDPWAHAARSYVPPLVPPGLADKSDAVMASKYAMMMNQIDMTQPTSKKLSDEILERMRMHTRGINIINRDPIGPIGSPDIITSTGDMIDVKMMGKPAKGKSYAVKPKVNLRRCAALKYFK